ncbi:hypothetical protein SAMN02787142_4385 [Burkholderia sp. WP9]|uniref:hypothetical protein n=1 Tax=Burkholderia sp. WP9 TaxID=1500263 RepID=UPI00089D6421|nr:hypothetical protein [Burkholderia sp. WP9]SEE68799.1 hypothetical protein SAMN02787142_4385 [Burkholderia sp. WP9]
MPGSTTTPGHPGARDCALRRFAFRYTDSVGTRNQFSIVAQWLACTYPCRRFADILADACARLGADVVRYSFIAVDLHHLLLAGLPAHPCENARSMRHPEKSTLQIALYWLGSHSGRVKRHPKTLHFRVFTRVRRETGKE